MRQHGNHYGTQMKKCVDDERPYDGEAPDIADMVEGVAAVGGEVVDSLDVEGWESRGVIACRRVARVSHLDSLALALLILRWSTYSVPSRRHPSLVASLKSLLITIRRMLAKLEVDL